MDRFQDTVWLSLAVNGVERDDQIAAIGSADRADGDSKGAIPLAVPAEPCVDLVPHLACHHAILAGAHGALAMTIRPADGTELA